MPFLVGVAFTLLHECSLVYCNLYSRPHILRLHTTSVTSTASMGLFTRLWSAYEHSLRRSSTLSYAR